MRVRAPYWDGYPTRAYVKKIGVYSDTNSKEPSAGGIAVEWITDNNKCVIMHIYTHLRHKVGRSYVQLLEGVLLLETLFVLVALEETRRRVHVQRLGSREERGVVMTWDDR